MIPLLRCMLLLLLALQSVLAADLDVELKRLDAFASDADGKLIVTAAVAEQLGVHRNRITLLRKETGRSYSSILVERLRSSGEGDSEVLRKVRLVNADVERQLSGRKPIQMLAYMTATWDYSSVGSVYTLVPEIGIDTGRVSFLASAPVYRLTGTQQSATGIGDVQVSAIVEHSGERASAWGSVSIGLPTGDRERGLGAGKVTADASGTLSWRFDKVRTFGTAGVTNSVFRNIGYQRPYITTGTAVYGSAGLEGTLTRWVGIGAGGFFLEPRGSQTVINRMTGGPMPAPTTGMTGGMHGGGSMTGMRVPAGTEVAAGELADRGANAWAWFAVNDAVSLNFTAARSVSLELTTVRVGLGFDIVRLLRH